MVYLHWTASHHFPIVPSGPVYGLCFYLHDHGCVLLFLLYQNSCRSRHHYMRILAHDILVHTNSLGLWAIEISMLADRSCEPAGKAYSDTVQGMIWPVIASQMRHK